MNRLMAAAVVAATAVLTVHPAEAKMTLKQFRDYSAMPGGGTLVRSYISGLRDGVVMLQRELEERGVEPTFCPGDIDLMEGKRFENILLREIETPSRGEPWPEDIQMGRLVTLALQSAFPCRTY